jgi:hypothetical protein
MAEKEKSAAKDPSIPEGPQPGVASDLEDLLFRIEVGLAGLDARSPNADLIGAMAALIVRAYRK